MIIDVVIPAYNEEGCVGKVVQDLDKNLVRNIVVVNNNSTDNTVEVAQNAGAIVLTETKQGYGAACLNGIAYINKQEIPADIIAFLDADYSDHPEQLIEVVQPILNGEIDMVIGSRNTGKREAGSMTPQQLFGNWLATFLIRIIYRVRYTDLGPFRAIRRKSLNELQMVDQTYGWTVEMQVKAIKHKMRIIEVPVDYRKRGAGKSKVAGTLKGTILAGYKIITTIFKYL